MLEISGIKINTDKALNKENEILFKKAGEVLRIKPDKIESVSIIRKSIDARRKPDLYFVYTLKVALKDQKKEEKILSKNPKVRKYKPQEIIIDKPSKSPKSRPVIVGAGPAGLFSALVLAQAGLNPVIYERGRSVDERSNDIEKFWKDGVLNEEDNVSFGEGGAGTFSDGKLNTQINDKFGRNTYVLKTFVSCGADESILYDAKPHLGTDKLKFIIKNLRKKIESLGGEFYFSSKVNDFKIKNGVLKEIHVNSEWIEVTDLVLAIGHSARDTIKRLYQLDIPMEAKNFAVGFRAEHPQSFIDLSQYGKERGGLPAASYKLSHNLSNGRGIYSFCMCPGGYVVNATSEEGTLVVNGMSYSGRDGKNANSAIVVSVGQNDFKGNDPLSSIRFQMDIEKKAYMAGHGLIPQQLYGDFKANRISRSYGRFESSTKGGRIFSDLTKILSPEINSAFISGMEAFGEKIKGFNADDVILSGIESRTSSPVRIIRSDKFESAVEGLYPCGEGAGYAGGITSAAMDGIKVGLEILKKYQE